MNQYETVVVLTPVLSDDDVKRTLEGYKELLKNNGAEMVHEELWGLNNWPTQSEKDHRYLLRNGV